MIWMCAVFAGAIKAGKGITLMDRFKGRLIDALLAPMAASLIRNILEKGIIPVCRRTTKNFSGQGKFHWITALW